MKKYIVKIAGTYTDQVFSFTDYESASSFAKLVLDHTEYKHATVEIEAVNVEPEPKADPDEDADAE